MFINFLCLCPCGFAMKLDFSKLKRLNIAKKYYKTKSAFWNLLFKVTVKKQNLIYNLSQHRTYKVASFLNIL